MPVSGCTVALASWTSFSRAPCKEAASTYLISTNVPAYILKSVKVAGYLGNGL